MSCSATDGDRLRGLWLSRELPFPPDMGDRIYSSNLAKSLAEAGTDLTLVGMHPEVNATIPADWPIKWQIVPGRARSTLSSLFSLKPLVAAAHSTSEYKEVVASLAKEYWDFVVLDQYGLGWALDAFRRKDPRKRPVLVHVAHDHESSVMESLFRGFRGSPVKRLGLWQNFLKTGAFERRIASNVDLVTAITEEDSARFHRDAPGVSTVVLKPGYSGPISAHRVIRYETPRRAVLVGSFKWIAKQENLRQFVAVADPIFAMRGIEFEVVGYMPPDFAVELKRGTKATRIIGPVDRLQPYFDAARIALVPEAIGGGFKLKFLDYIFGRVPVATLTQAAAGLPGDILAAMSCSDNLRDLALATADLIDKVDRLNEMQEIAFERAQALFMWQDRGTALLAAIRACKISKTHASEVT